MFTGIITAIGLIDEIREINGGRELDVSCKNFFKESNIGDSVALNGICLTITKHNENRATFFAQIETLEKTTLVYWEKGLEVNLEHPLRLGDRLGGHMVLGHVDGIAEIGEIVSNSDGSSRFTIAAPHKFSKYIVLKGSVTLDGVSLTVASVGEFTFDVALIPATLELTNFSNLTTGDQINIEIDTIARYVEQLLPNP